MAGSERERDVSAEGDETGGRGLGRFAAGLIFGVVLGAGLALLLAPERGDRTRRRLRRRLERLREDTADEHRPGAIPSGASSSGVANRSRAAAGLL